MKAKLPVTDKLYIAALLLSVASFVLPSMKMVIAGETYNMYFIGSYGGRVVFAVLLVAGIILQVIVYARSKKWLSWLGFVCGLYAAVYAGNQLYKCMIRFRTNRPSTLVDKLHPECFPLAGVWLLLAAAILLVLVAAIKITRRSLLNKQIPGADS